VKNLDSDSILKAVLKKLGKKYEYKKSLGGGGYSNVYLIRHTIFLEEHALKIMDYHYIRQKLKKENIDNYKKAFNEIKIRFMNEARFYKRINHPNIVEIHDIDMIEDEKENIEIPYIIMDYIEGSSLDRILKGEAPIELRRVLRISQNVLDALETIHKEKVIHRDIKPANIMIKERTGEAILIDFGLAKDKLNETTLTSSGVTMGTPPYMSPDQFRNPKNIDYTTDIYSFGVVLYEMLTGEFPFGGEKDKIIYGHLLKEPPNVRDKNPDLPVGIEDIIYKAMAKEPQQRYKSAGEFRKALNQVEETQKMISKENGKDMGTEKIEIIKPEDEKKEKKPGKIVLRQKDKEEIEKRKKIKDVELKVSKEDEREKIKEEEKDIKQERKSKKKPIKYFIISALLITFIAAIVTFIVFDPFGIIPGKSKVKIDYSEKIEGMKGDFERLTAFLKGGASNKDKLVKCQEFLKKHQDVPKNDETTKMFSDINNLVKTLIKETEYATGETRPIEPVKVSRLQDEPETGSVEIEPISYKIFDYSGIKPRSSSPNHSDPSLRWFFKRRTVTIKRSKTQRVYIAGDSTGKAKWAVDDEIIINGERIKGFSQEMTQIGYIPESKCLPPCDITHLVSTDRKTILDIRLVDYGVFWGNTSLYLVIITHSDQLFKGFKGTGKVPRHFLLPQPLLVKSYWETAIVLALTGDPLGKEFESPGYPLVH
jgi:serine/threonine protein kinase